MKTINAAYIDASGEMVSTTVHMRTTPLITDVQMENLKAALSGIALFLILNLAGYVEGSSFPF